MRTFRRSDDVPKRKLVTVDTSFGPFACWEGDRITTVLRKFGAHQRSDLAMALSFVHQGDWVIDVGAHIGTFSVPLGQAVGPTGHVFAFEPVPDTFDLLCQNVANCGLGDVVTPINGVVTQAHSAVHMWRNPNNTGNTTFWHSSGEELSGLRQFELDTWWQEVEAGDHRVALVKIDVEGMEYDVLRSGEQLIESHNPIVVFEVGVGGFSGASADSPNQALSRIEEFFSDHGYDLFVNEHSRHGTDDVFELSPLPSLTPSRLPGKLADVLAVPASSARHP